MVTGPASTMTIIVGSYSIRDNSLSCLSPAMMKLHTSCNLHLSSFFIESALSNSKYLSIWLASGKPFRLVPFVQQLSLLALIYYATRAFLYRPKPPPGLPTRAFGTRPLRLYAFLPRDLSPASRFGNREMISLLVMSLLRVIVLMVIVMITIIMKKAYGIQMNLVKIMD